MTIQHDWQDTALAQPAGRDLTAQFLASALAPPANDIALQAPSFAWSKRALDLAIALPLAVLLAPVLLAIALAVRLDSAGAVLFRQTRLGAGGEPFTIYKFRTMTVSENGDRVTQARRNDPRVTRIGRFLRRTSLDELPQLLNVIEGTMSIVGPRPHARAHDEYYAKVIPHYTLRQRVKPGITGWAQVNGHRGETPTVESMRARIDHDAWYVAHAGLGLDLKILWRTAHALIHPRNAY